MHPGGATVFGAIFLAAVAASAAEGPKGLNDTGKGGPGPGGGTSTEGNLSSPTGIESGINSRTNPDVDDVRTTAYKPWEAGASFTVHRLVVQGDQSGGTADPKGEPPSGNAVVKECNDYQLYLRYDITRNDRIGVSAYVYEYFLADQGENGVRFDDMGFSYTHIFKLPRKVRVQAGLVVTAPTSFASQLAGLITAFHPKVAIDRRFGPFSVALGVSDTVFIQRYESYAGSGGGAPTSLDTLSATLEIEFHAPFHEPFSVGIDVFDGYNWANNVQSGVGPGQSSGNSTKDAAGGGVSDAVFHTQPIQQTYGWDTYLRYILPDLFGFKSDLTFSYNFGDGAVGYTSLLQDGIGHLFLGFRHNSVLDLSLSLRY